MVEFGQGAFLTFIVELPKGGLDASRLLFFCGFASTSGGCADCHFW